MKINTKHEQINNEFGTVVDRQLWNFPVGKVIKDLKTSYSINNMVSRIYDETEELIRYDK